MGPKTNSKQNKNANKKGKQSESYFADDKNYDSFSAQLVKLGLELRDITGDGNCCFRALSDQINGDETLHLDIRRRACDYMLRNRDEFEPFVAALMDESDDDDDHKKNKKTSHKNMDAFELYIKNLEKPGTYADNGVLVAFARLYNYDINIHQLDLPIWTIGSGITKKNQPVRQLHLSYHNGEHYSSIRPKGDRTNNPTNIVVNDNNNKTASNAASKNGYDYLNEANHYQPEIEDFDLNQELSKFSDEAMNNLNVEQVIDSTDCHDVNLILDMLKKNDNDVTLTIGSLLSEMQLENDDKKETKSRPGSKQVKTDKKKDKKIRQMERQRSKLLEQSQETNSMRKKELNQITEIHSTPETTEFNIMLNNIEKKSI